MVTREYRRKRRIEDWEEFSRRVDETESHEELVGLYKVGWRIPSPQPDMIRVYSLALNTSSMEVIKAAAEGMIEWSRKNSLLRHNFDDQQSFAASLGDLLKLFNSSAKWLRPPYNVYLAEFCRKVLESVRQDGRLGDTWAFFQRDLFNLVIKLGRFDLLTGQDTLALEPLAEWLWPGSGSVGQVGRFDLKRKLETPEKRQAAMAYIEIAFVADRLPRN